MRIIPSGRSRLCAIAAAVALLGSVSQALADDIGTELSQAFTNGDFQLGFRYRYEHVDQDVVSDEANASTLRTRLVYKSAEFRNIVLTLNMDDLRRVVANDFNDTRNGKAQYPVVADPNGTDLNLASLTFTGLEDATIVLGRQRIIRGNARFVGNVGWRQNEQTYDSASIDYAVSDGFQVFYGYVDRVKRIFGPDAGTPAPSLSTNSHLLNASYSVSPQLSLDAYGYWLDFRDAAALSNQTLGLRLTGSVGEEIKVKYSAEFARQKSYKNNPNDYQENYYHFDAGLDGSRFGVKVGYESLGGSGSTPTTFGQAFQTPLATLHKFNGRADQFLRTPGNGLEDVYVEGTAKALGGKFTLTYHDFSPETGAGDFGSEWDLFASWPFLEHYSVVAGIALFDANAGFLSDVNKAWLMVSANF